MRTFYILLFILQPALKSNAQIFEYFYDYTSRLSPDEIKRIIRRGHAQEDRIKDLTKEVEQAKKKHIVWRENPQTKAENERLKEDNWRKTVLTEKVTREKERLQNELERANRDKKLLEEKHSSEIAQLERKNSKLKADLQAKEENIKFLEEKIAEFQAYQKQLEEQIEQYKSALEEKTRELFVKTDELNRTRKWLTELGTDVLIPVGKNQLSLKNNVTFKRCKFSRKRTLIIPITYYRLPEEVKESENTVEARVYLYPPNWSNYGITPPEEFSYKVKEKWGDTPLKFDLGRPSGEASKLKRGKLYQGVFTLTLNNSRNISSGLYTVDIVIDNLMMVKYSFILK